MINCYYGPISNNCAKINRMSKLQVREPDWNSADPGVESPGTGQKWALWGKIGLTAASALLGGIAVALLNRHTLQNIQQRMENLPPPPSNDDIY